MYELSGTNPVNNVQQMHKNIMHALTNNYCLAFFSIMPLFVDAFHFAYVTVCRVFVVLLRHVGALPSYEDDELRVPGEDVLLEELFDELLVVVLLDSSPLMPTDGCSWLSSP